MRRVMAAILVTVTALSAGCSSSFMYTLFGLGP